ncbi:DEAD/DEAH box helicase [Kaarinaea lacus]
MSSESAATVSFADLSLINPVLKALDAAGYETPTPIQAETIPHILAGRDVLGQAQTGTGKTAAFALPLLSRIDLKLAEPQVLVLAPTRELAIQVAEAFHRYAANLSGFHVLPIYGGQDYSVQLKQLKRGVHVVVGTPGRVMDHMRRGTLKLDALKCLVLDEGDEMLRMGFVEDIEWILQQTPAKRQIALFSATMPNPIRRIAQQHLHDPVEISIKVRTTTAETIRQRYWNVSGVHKLDALTRILEAEPFDGMIIFVRTKTGTVELAEKLEARGYACAPLNGDIPQKQRERTVEQLKSGKLDILIATDVAARGLDVKRISHIINYDIPYDTEAYVHRIGRTGRAGRSGEAILFVAPREQKLLYAIEKATRQKIEKMELPSTEAINNERIARFTQRITDTLATEELAFYYQLLDQYQQKHNVSALDIAAALAKLVQGDKSLLLHNKPEKSAARDTEKSTRHDRAEKSSRRDRPEKRREPGPVKLGMDRYRIEVGNVHGVKPGNIVGAIANEIGLDSEFIGRIDIHDDYSTVDLPEGMPKDVFKTLKTVWVAGQQLKISRLGEKSGSKNQFKDKNKDKDKEKIKNKHKPKRKPKPKSKPKPQREKNPVA